MQGFGVAHRRSGDNRSAATPERNRRDGYEAPPTPPRRERRRRPPHEHAALVGGVLLPGPIAGLSEATQVIERWGGAPGSRSGTRLAALHSRIAGIASGQPGGRCSGIGRASRPGRISWGAAGIAVGGIARHYRRPDDRTGRLCQRDQRTVSTGSVGRRMVDDVSNEGSAPADQSNRRTLDLRITSQRVEHTMPPAQGEAGHFVAHAVLQIIRSDTEVTTTDGEAFSAISTNRFFRSTTRRAPSVEGLEGLRRVSARAVPHTGHAECRDRFRKDPG